MSAQPACKSNWINHYLVQNTGTDILSEDTKLSYGDVSAGNTLIQGDNLTALNCLLPIYQNKVKCIYLDPPYNTKRRFRHYGDNLSHSSWLNMMHVRLELLRTLLAEDGSIWVSIDDQEVHYLKICMDEIFGRHNFVANCVWQRTFCRNSLSNMFSRDHEHMIIFAKNKKKWLPGLLPRNEITDSYYSNPDNHPKGVWQANNLYCRRGAENRSSENFSHVFSNGIIWKPRKWYFSRFSHEELIDFEKNGEIWFGHDGCTVPAKKSFLSELRRNGLPAKTLWSYQEVGSTHEAKFEINALGLPTIFDTPKPERFISRILHLGSQPGDLILDGFLGSGTTAAVALKMGRRFIGIEIGEHARDLCALRLKQVINGEQGGVSRAFNWQGGGGFRFFNTKND